MNELSCAEMNAVWRVKKLLEREQRRLKDLEVFSSSTSPILDGMPHAKPLVYKVERLATMMCECQSRIDELAEQLIQAKFDLLNRIQSQRINELYERVLCYHYVSCLKMFEVAKLIGYTREHIWKLHNRGLKALGLNPTEMKHVKVATLGYAD